MDQTRPKTVVANLYCVLCYLACWRQDSCGGGGADKRHVRKHVSVTTGQDSDVSCMQRGGRCQPTPCARKFNSVTCAARSNVCAGIKKIDMCQPFGGTERTKSN
jgi:hypothetical protein